MNLDALILKIIEYKNNSELEEVKVDLNRVCTQGFGNDTADIGYMSYLYKHYSNEIQFINSFQQPILNGINNKYISDVENIRNYLIKIAIIRICNKEAIQYEIQKMNDTNYCMNLIDNI